MNHFQLVGFNQVTWKHSKFKCFVVWTLMSLYLDFNISVLLATNFTSMESHSSKDKVLLTLESRAVCCNYKQESLRLSFRNLVFHHCTNFEFCRSLALKPFSCQVNFYELRYELMVTTGWFQEWFLHWHISLPILLWTSLIS